MLNKSINQHKGSKNCTFGDYDCKRKLHTGYYTFNSHMQVTGRIFATEKFGHNVNKLISMNNEKRLSHRVQRCQVGEHTHLSLNSLFDFCRLQFIR